MSKTVVSSRGISTFGLLGIIFVTLKLCGVITWSWWYVTMPFWAGLALWLGLILIGVAISFIILLIVWALVK